MFVLFGDELFAIPIRKDLLADRFDSKNENGGEDDDDGHGDADRNAEELLLRKSFNL